MALCGRAVRRLHPLDSGQFMHFVVLNGYQDGDCDTEHLVLTVSSCLMLRRVNWLQFLVYSLA